MKYYLKKFFYPFLLVFLSIIFFWQFFFKGLLPIPSDTIVGLYHPFRDLYAKEYPRGIPFKNFLITDPVRQQYVWKKLAIEQEKRIELPIWNPYSFSGTPLLANFQSSAFYPLNLLLLFLPFNLGWSLMIIFQVILAGIFMYSYLRNQKLNSEASLIGGISFAFSGFFIAWLEWNTIIQTALWLPLILLSIEKIFSESKKLKWQIIFALSLVFSFFAGHLQIFFYEMLFLIFYVVFYIDKKRLVRKNLYLIGLSILIALILSIPQLIPTLRFILLSARGLDQVWTNPGWFIPVQNLVQFVVPDYFGNPTTLNYFGIWNYAEFIGFIGVIPLIFAFYGLLTQQKKLAFFGLVILICLLFAIQNPISELPFKLNIPFISSSQPTRLIFLITFCLSVLASFGLNQFIKQKDKRILSVIIIFLGVFGLLFALTYFNAFKISDPQNLLVSRRNLYFPFAIFACGSLLIFAFLFLKDKKIGRFIILGLIAITVIDLFRFGWKFTPFTKSEYLFPETKTISFLQNQQDKNFRIMSQDARILPPNFSSIYRMQSIEGYDPLYLQRYAELITAMQRNKPDISPPFGFNRIVTPHDLDNKFIDLLNVKYMLSLSEISNPSYRLVFEEGETKVYENMNNLPRTFFVGSVINTKDKYETIKKVFDEAIEFNKTAVVEDANSSGDYSLGKASIVSYSDNEVIIQTENQGDGFLVLLDSFYPTWRAKIDGVDSKIFITNYNFRGIQVPEGKHTIRFYISLL